MDYSKLFHVEHGPYTIISSPSRFHVEHFSKIFLPIPPLLGNFVGLFYFKT